MMLPLHYKGNHLCSCRRKWGGKSTLFKSIMGFQNPQQGNIALCGLPINRALKQNLVAYVPQAEEVDWQFQSPFMMLS